MLLFIHDDNENDKQTVDILCKRIKEKIKLAWIYKSKQIYFINGIPTKNNQ